MSDDEIDLRSRPGGHLTGDDVDKLRTLTHRWALEILMVLSAGPSRYSSLLRGIPGINQRVLTERLKELEADGLVDRSEERDRPSQRGPGRLQVTYTLTARGEQLQPVLREIRSWLTMRTDGSAARPTM